MFKYSMIIATLGRKIELIEAIKSIQESDYNLENIQIIIVDQNKKGFLDQDIKMFKKLNILHIHSDIKGLSVNRNIGLKYATGDIVCFPDDDCKFYKDTLITISRTLSSKNIDFCIGRIFDREKKINIIKKWPKRKMNIKKINSYFLNSSITLFLKKKAFNIEFDENLGVGSKFGSCEDADFIYRLLNNKAKGVYSPNIELWHPEVNYQIISLDKVRSYAAGFGYFIKKEMDFVKVLLLILLIGKKLFQLSLNFFNHKFPHGYFKSFFKGLLSGIKSDSN